jgi:hypothetical protein
MSEEVVKEKEILVWQKSTWGSFGQHANVYTFVLLDNRWEPIFKAVPVRHENHDSSKNYHRYTYVKKPDLAKIEGKVVKMINDYKSSRKRSIDVKYYIVQGGELVELPAEQGLRDEAGFYNVVSLSDGRKLIDRKDFVQFI